ncbi:hypothetical protein [Halobaculum litoreum]|uniref:hypothetical protein n=1 Tax=Halobaculum litoreum TaxID=3031998 RepID=UPI0024C34E23|nr:hypothetical protein [Halobaculum sp. DT92]
MVDDTPDTDEEDAGRRAAAPDDDRADGEADAPSVANPFGDDPVVDAGADDDAPDGDAADAAPSADDRASRGDAPFGDLARRVEERRHGPSESESESDPESDPFETVDVGEVDEDDLWASLGEESAAASAASLDAAESVDGAAGEANGRPEHVVDKRAYCQRCPFLSAPPAVACGHEGSTIVEAVDGDRFRVRGCPMVTEEGSPNFAAVAGGAPAGGDETDAPPGVGGDAGAHTGVDDGDEVAPGVDLDPDDFLDDDA